jgi:hypothetical protein
LAIVGICYTLTCMVNTVKHTERDCNYGRKTKRPVCEGDLDAISLQVKLADDTVTYNSFKKKTDSRMSLRCALQARLV